MGVPEFGNVKGDVGLAKLNEHMMTKSYVTGCTLTQDDVKVARNLIGAPGASKYPHVLRWYKHVMHFDTYQQSRFQKGAMPIGIPNKASEDDDIDLFGDDSDDAETVKKMKEASASGGVKKKKEVINKSSLVIDVKPKLVDTNLKELYDTITKTVKIEGLTWGAGLKKVPVAFGLYKLQISCTIIDDLVDTDEILENLECIGMSEEYAKEYIKKRSKGEDDEDDEDEEENTFGSGLVMSTEILSFNKL